MRNWKAMAEAAGLEITERELDLIAATLDSLDRAFQPIASDLPPELEPDPVFQTGEDRL